jgi:hypothetical protein
LPAIYSFCRIASALRSKKSIELWEVIMADISPSVDKIAGKTPDHDAGASGFQGTPPALSLPKGGGAIRGMGEKFAANPVTGTASMTVPIFTSPGRSGFGPQLALSYDSGAGNGPFGFGWNLSVPAITRKTVQRQL